MSKPSNFVQFDTGEEVTPVEQRQVPSRRAGDMDHKTNLEIIAHKTSRIAGELTEFKADMHKAIDRIEAAMRYNHATVTEAIQRTSKKMEELDKRVDQTINDAIAQAVPDGDIDGHRRHHEALIKKAEESAEFWANMRKKLAEWGLIGFIGWALIALWQAFLLGPKK